MSTETRTQPDLDLSTLDRETRINIWVAVARGATWKMPSMSAIVGVLQRSNEDLVVVWHDGSVDVCTTLPRVTRDPAAWGALLEEEGVWPEPLFDRDGGVDSWVGNYRAGADLFERTAIVSTPGEAVAFAVLAKHGVEVPA